MGKFSFNGVTIVAPGFILKSSIGTQRILNLLPFGKILMIGTSDGGQGNGTVYDFNDLDTARAVLRDGALLDALLMAGAVGGASAFAGVVAGRKTPSTATITNGGAVGVLTSGDQGAWTTGIEYAITVPGTAGSGTFAFSVQYPNPDGQLITVGGIGSINFDNLTDFNALAAAIANDPVLTPPAVSGLVPIVTFSVTTNGTPTSSTGLTPLVGGSGTGDYVNTTVLASPPPSSTVIGVASTAGISVGSVLWVGYYDINGLFHGAYGTVAGIAGNVITFSSAVGSPIAGNLVLSIVSTDFNAAINNIADEPFDIGHLVNGYGSAEQAYADELSAETAPLGRLSRWFHQVQVPSASPTQSKQFNSAAVVAAGTGRATLLNSPRSSVIAQRTQTLDPTTGLQIMADLAPIICGYAALVGATGPNGPATAMTQDTIPACIELDYPILGTNNNFISPGGTDLDRAILGGLMPFVNLFPSGVRCSQSITTAPNDPTGIPWIYAEFSVQRVVDALQANMVAAISSMQPKGLGAGITIKVAGAILTEMQDVLELASQAQWITGYNQSAIAFNPVPASPDDAIVTYDCTPVFPLNHLGISQTVQPFSITAQQLTTALG